MPTYRNTQNHTVMYNGKMFRPGLDVAVGFFVPPELGFDLADSAPPIRSPLLWAGTLTDESLDIPAADKITISSVTDSAATVFFADDDMGTQITAAYGDNTTARWSRIGKLRVEGTAYIKIWREEE
jgi:hypothetical protein